MPVLVSVSNAGKRHRGHSNSYKEYLLEVAAYSSEVYSTITAGSMVAGHGSMQADMLLENSTSLSKGIRNWTEIMGIS